MIDTPLGPIAVEDLRQGMIVWTATATGERIEAVIIKTSATHVPESFMMVSIKLSDGRTITASPGHPSAVGRPLGNYQVGDILDGGKVTEVSYAPNANGVTYDILPAGGTGLYWANGILLKSTLTVG